MRRRPKGTGTIRRTPEGKHRALFAFVAGKPREEIDGSPFATREAAEAALDGILEQLHGAGAARGGLTLRQAGKRAFELREADGFRSVADERGWWARHVETSDLIDCPIALISKGELRELVTKARKKNGKRLATSSRRNLRNALSVVYAVAEEDGHAEDNIAATIKVKDSGATDRTKRPLSCSQANRIIGVATDLIVPIAIGTGMRSGELRALSWSKVHVDVADPHVECFMGKPNEPRKNGQILIVPLFGIALDAFRRLWELRGRPTAGIVFAAKRGGFRPKGRAVGRDEWKAWLAAAGIDRRVRFHDLRHTCATLLLNGDFGRQWSYEEVKEMLGHSSVKVTERYAKALGTLATSAAAAMRAASDKGGTRAVASDEIRAQAREIIGRRGWDSNPRMTVLQLKPQPCDPVGLEALALHSRSYIEAVASGDPTAYAKGLELAEAAWSFADAQTAVRETA